MTDDEAIDEAVRRTGVERFRVLCSGANTLDPPNSRDDYLRHVRELAAAPPPPPPTAAQMASGLGRSLWDWAVSGFSMASDEERARRLSICGGCERWDAGARRCGLCGCYTDYKVGMKTEHCPLDPPKW